MKRLLTALVLIPLVSYVVFWAPPWAFLAVVVLVAGLCFHEYSGLVAAHGIERPGPAAYAAGLLVLFVQRFEILAVTLIALAALGLVLKARDLSKCLPGAAALLLGVIYIFGAWRCTIPLRGASPHWLFYALALNWVGDSAAYYAGSAFGRHKMAPRLSPSKSWEGAAASVAASLLFGVIYLGWFLPSVTIWQRIGITIAVNLAGQIGDLAESAMKRGAQMKDSSSLLPGHGGWLDRVDSTLFALPVLYALVSLLAR